MGWAFGEGSIQKRWNKSDLLKNDRAFTSRYVYWEFSFPYKIPFIKLSVENTDRITRVFRLKSFFTALSTNISINYTERSVCPSLREPTRAEWRDTKLF
jgi:hypothetical protein